MDHDSSSELATMDDQTFLAERTRIRESIEELKECMRRLDAEFDRRARSAWTSTSSQ